MISKLSIFAENLKAKNNQFIMKKVLFILLCVLCSNFAQSQKSKLVNFEIDEFTGDTVVTTKPVTLFNALVTSNCFLDLSFSKVNDIVAVVANLSIPASSPYPAISKGRNLYLKLLDGNIITLTAFSDAIEALSLTRQVQMYLVTMGDLMKIKDIGIEKFRIETNNKDYENITKPQKKVNKKLEETISAFIEVVNGVNQ